MHGLSVLPFVYQETNGSSQFYEVQMMNERMFVLKNSVFVFQTYITTALYHCTAMCECHLCILKLELIFLKG